MDALSEVLRSFRLRGSFHAAWELRAPWGLSFHKSLHAPFHHIESGEAWLCVDDGRRIRLEAGDVVVLFDGGGHRICDRPASPAERIEVVSARQGRSLSRRYGARAS